MNPLLNIAIRSIHQIGKLILKMYDENPLYRSIDHYKMINPLFERIKKIVISTIFQHYSDHELFLNEKRISFNNKTCQKKTRWFINFLEDGVNWMKKIPHFCTSISIYQKERMIILVIYDPILNEMFSANRGGGARLNQYRLRVQEKSSLNASIILSVNQIFQKDVDHLSKYLKILHILLKNYLVRITGSISLDLAYVAASRIDAMILIGNGKEINQKISRISLLLKESGGTLIYGKLLNINSREKKERTKKNEFSSEEEKEDHSLQIVCAGSFRTTKSITKFLKNQFNISFFKE
ncbi:inositol monophosphatase family protein [Candidatus Riesia pediculicola]|uniref:Inositol-1-monophosphatase n=1 Tax=Riesia pediculicola (strain USDA) TaxID=515618 RepID=D4G8C6_RIEPU|nr:inositol monophosphatase family protein [Candidatus Riesia pediculicola]ADD79899.1 inositol-1-monophosphatase [Candidatus Riesia pediculicola USDA]ARC53818.1 hypothetical protein AOE55_01475 [Candidatus Riesia pediculicola]QOJ86451.1 hypothetical protein ILQ01_01390 [Candidatus Riesia pediculicola]